MKKKSWQIEKVGALALRSRKRQEWSFSSLLLNTMLKVLHKDLRKEKEINGTEIGKENF